MAKIVIADSHFVVSDIEQTMIEDASIKFARFQDKSAAVIRSEERRVGKECRL